RCRFNDFRYVREANFRVDVVPELGQLHRNLTVDAGLGNHPQHIAVMRGARTRLRRVRDVLTKVRQDDGYAFGLKVGGGADGGRYIFTRHETADGLAGEPIAGKGLTKPRVFRSVQEDVAGDSHGLAMVYIMRCPRKSKPTFAFPV